MPVNYADGKVYTVVNDLNDIIYVGSTAQPRLCSRMTGHRRLATEHGRDSAFYTAMRTIGADHFTIRLHHSFPCKSKDELVAEEMKTLDELIAAGKTVYNRVIGGKYADEAKKKMAVAKTGKVQDKCNSFSMGCISFQKKKSPSWIFIWTDNGKQTSKSFSVAKYGNYGAHWRCEEVRRQIYPEWGNDEDIAGDDLGHIEWE
jgi:hypothetical protein